MRCFTTAALFLGGPRGIRRGRGDKGRARPSAFLWTRGWHVPTSVRRRTRSHESIVVCPLPRTNRVRGTSQLKYRDPTTPRVRSPPHHLNRAHLCIRHAVHLDLHLRVLGFQAALVRPPHHPA